MMKYKIGMLLVVAFLFNTVIAQTIEQGKQFVYYERYKSARETFQNLLKENPNNEDAVYWLGQAMILSDDRTPKDLTDAKKLYQSKLSISNSNLLMAGIGHIELMEGESLAARNHFDAALSLSQNKNISVLNAVGFANSNPDSKNGDPAYAIEKLLIATQFKKMNDPDIWVNLGDAYRKNDKGGDALASYRKALEINPKYARANYRIGKLYQSQGKGQESIFMEHYDDAIANDPLYAPVYANLFNYYYETNVPKAAEYFEKWLANSDEDYKSCYYRARMKYAQGLFLEAINKSTECISADLQNPYPKLFWLKANAYNRLKDSLNTVDCYAEYFKREKIENITSADYFEYVKNLLKIPGNEAQAAMFVDKAVALDSVETNKIQYLKIMAQAFEAKKSFKDAADWYSKILAVKKNLTKFDINTTAFNYYKGGSYQQSIDIFNLSLSKFPDDPYAYNMIGKSSWAIDTTMTLGLANVAFDKVIELGLADTIKFKPQLMTAYKYFVAYHANIKKDKVTAIAYVDKALSLDPADAEANNFKVALTATKKTTAPAQKPLPNNAAKTPN